MVCGASAWGSRVGGSSLRRLHRTIGDLSPRLMQPNTMRCCRSKTIVSDIHNSWGGCPSHRYAMSPMHRYRLSTYQVRNPLAGNPSRISIAIPQRLLWICPLCSSIHNSLMSRLLRNQVAWVGKMSRGLGFPCRTCMATRLQHYQNRHRPSLRLI